MKRILLPIFLALSIVCFAQKNDKRKGSYSIYLCSVDNPKGIETGKLDTTLSMYEDSLIKIDWDYAVSQIGFVLTNRSDETMKIIWDEAAFISLSNETHRVFHKGIKYIDRENPQSPTLVYKGTTLSDLVSPTSFTRYVAGRYGGWTSEPILEFKQADSNKAPFREELIDKIIRVILPIKINEKTLEYGFNFKTTFKDKEK
ncbi:Uncharacterised protein [Sphingobacterium spiritivorum]|uniref:Uncharacterized protein n=1 Tax=Sphingobacterium spiritivorum TaxID=258 RepID=A0A380CRF5_SPHSI|nr:hypothetical protein [Sphingobacterium spiritivorum]SUJ26429.1 Uncharacterised protein [Sphingobacterium spiritivorum]